MSETTVRPLPRGIAPISANEARVLVRHDSGAALEALMARASAVREAVHGREVALCGITNAKSGRCPEDCGFCSQSARHREADAPVYGLLSPDEIVAQAKAAERAGAREFSIVISGTRASERELTILEEAIRRIRAETAVEPCASLGLVRDGELARLKAAGLLHYHHNLETARSFFPNVCTTHSYESQLETIRAAKAQGMKLCAGGILGMGETPEQRVELAEELRGLGVDCVPLNFLNPRPGTPMANLRAITPGECLAAIAVFRLMMPGAHVFVMGGREVNLGARQELIFKAGADGTMVGNYLTSAGRSPDRTVAMIEGQGLALRPPATGQRWAFQGEAPAEADWNRRAVEGERGAASRACPNATTRGATIGSQGLRSHIARELARLEGDGLLRRTTAWPQAGGAIWLEDGRTMMNLSSNDYLALARDPAVVSRAAEALARYGAGACASRLMCGTLEVHEELERALAALCGTGAALVFSSDFGTNAGLLPALAGRGDVLFLDRLVHASIVDGARLSGATPVRFPHGDVDALARLVERTPCRGRRVIVCESVYSMDGDVAPLVELEALARRVDAALVVDEAHAVGVFGGGGGLCRALGVRPDVLVGTLGKALGSVGGFVACDPELRAFLLNRCRSFVFATALAPASAAAALGAIERLRAEPGLGETLRAHARGFQRALAAHGLAVPAVGTQILPVHVGGNAEALALAARLREEGLLVTAVRPPTVPVGTARLRLSVTLAHAPAALERAAESIGRAARAAVAA